MAKIIRVFPRHTSHTPKDELSFSPKWRGADPGLFRPDADEVHISVTFTWDKLEGERLAQAWAQYYPVVKLGGPAYDMSPKGFVPGRYLEHGVTFTSYGCNRRCPWCLVPGREGRLTEVTDFPDGWVIQDNNILQCSREHIARVFEMLKKQPYAARFTGGLDARLVDDWVADRFAELRAMRKLDVLFLAADTSRALRGLGRAIETLRRRAEKAGTEYHINKLRVYTLVAFGGETTKEAERRLRAVWKAGGMPHAQLYQPADHYIEYDKPWRDFQRVWTREAIIKARMADAS